MININPSDFSTDDLYTKMEEVRGKMQPIITRWNAISEDFKSVKKYLSSLPLMNSSCISFGDKALEWDDEQKELFIGNKDGFQELFQMKPALECSIDLRIAAHPFLLDLLDEIIKDMELFHAN
jgi:hypothetical protein